MFSEKMGKFLRKIGKGTSSYVEASNILASGTAVVIMAAGVPIDSNLGVDHMRVPSRIERFKAFDGTENLTLSNYCKMYRDMYYQSFRKKNIELDFYEEIFT